MKITDLKTFVVGAAWRNLIFVRLETDEGIHGCAEATSHNKTAAILGYFEEVLRHNPAGDKHLVGARLSYPDLSLFQMVAGLRYAFPRAMARLERRIPRVVALHDRVAARPRIAAYLASERRIPFNEEGIFRHYPELDAAP